MTTERTRPSVNRGHLTSAFSGRLTSALSNQAPLENTRTPGGSPKFGLDILKEGSATA
jgi:hypothetical protein